MSSGVACFQSTSTSKKAFTTVHRKKLWEIPRFRGVPTRITKLIACLYTGTENVGKHGGGPVEILFC